jgi:hypothetical protein
MFFLRRENKRRKINMLGAWDLNKNFTPKFRTGDRIKAKMGIETAIVAADLFLNEPGREVMFLIGLDGYFDCDFWEKI